MPQENQEQVQPTIGSTVNLPTTGAFYESLTRSNSQIKKDRADQIGRMLMKQYQRKIEDLDDEIYQETVSRENMLDLSPNNIGSLQPAVNFDADKFLMQDVDSGIRLRELKIKSNIVRSRFNHLFGTTYDLLNSEI